MLSKYIVTIGDDLQALHFSRWAKKSQDIKHFKEAKIAGSHTLCFYTTEATAKLIEEAGYYIHT